MDKILIIGYKVSQHFNLPSNLISGFVQLTLLHIHTYFAYTRGVYTYTPYMHIQDVHIHMCIYKRCIYRIYRGHFFKIRVTIIFQVAAVCHSFFLLVLFQTTLEGCFLS